MAEEPNKLEELSKKLDDLMSMHNTVSNEISSLRTEIVRLKNAQKRSSLHSSIEEASTQQPIIKPDIKPPSAEIKKGEVLKSNIQNEPVGDPLPTRTISSRSEHRKVKKFDIEKLIGENLINKIGILVLIIGVAIGAKYSIENDLISPLTRIVLGYLTGVVLLGLGMYLKKNYLNFSAVLVSGAMSILYFITFFAFDFYQLIGQEVAFGLMVIFTIFTVLAALNYNKEIIAHLGFVGAMSIPFLLGDDAGNVLILFSYVTIVNLGIAFISLKKHWKFLFYSSFVITWLVFFSWFMFGYERDDHFTLALIFLTIFFVLFYVIFIAYKFINLKKYNALDVVVLLFNSALFFGFGYSILFDHEQGNQVLGIFALVNALIHFIAAYIINQRKLADRNLFYLIIGLVLVCLTIAIPIQLDGLWVSMLWAGEALVVFLIGRSRKVAFYEYISLALIAVAGMSLMQDWELGYAVINEIYTYSPTSPSEPFTFLFNPIFLTSIIAILCLGLITWIHFKPDWKKDSAVDKSIMDIMDFAFPISFIALIFYSFRLEIINYFNQMYVDSGIQPNTDNGSIYNQIFNINIELKAHVWLAVFALLYFSIVSFFVLKKVKNNKANWAMVAVNVLVILVYLLQGLFNLSELRENFLSQENSEYFIIDKSFLGLRYFSICALGLLIVCTHFLLKKINPNRIIKIIAEVSFYLVMLWVTTSELIHWLDFTDKSETYGLALSIFWGIFSFIIIAIGIWKKKKHIRILGIAIFGVTLIKLLFYDLSHLKTLSKTVLMISLGALMLLTSFLYNKYKIEDEHDD